MLSSPVSLESRIVENPVEGIQFQATHDPVEENAASGHAYADEFPEL
jgi:hypothetical protein